MMRYTLAAFAPILLLAACAQPSPVLLSASYQMPPNRAKLSRTSAAAPRAICRLHVGQLRDLRSDTRSLGEIGGRPIHAMDVQAWVRSGLLSLDRNGTIVLVESGQESDADISVDIQRAYVFSQATTKAANIALTVHYNSRTGAVVDDRSFRGSDEGMNWASGDSEAQSALNRALANALEQLQTNILAHCTARPAAD